MKSFYLPSKLKSWMFYLLLIGGVVVVTTVIRTEIFSIIRLQGSSMNPSYYDGDLLFLKKWGAAPQVRDLVVFKSRAFPKQLIKRVIALGPARVQIENFKVLVNGKEFIESSIEPPTWDHGGFLCAYSGIYTVQHDEVFVMGDNRCLAEDSRHFGPIKKSMIRGVVRAHLWSSSKKLHK